MAFFDEMARTPGRLLNDAVRLASTRLPGRRVDVSIGGATVPLRVESVAIEGIEPDIESATDTLIDMAFRLSESAARNAMDPLAFGNDAVDTLAGALQSALGSAPARALRGEIDIASAASARLVDVTGDGGATASTSTASVDLECGAVTGRLTTGLVLSADGVTITARVAAAALADWLRRLGVELGPSAEVVPGDDGLLRVAMGEGRLGLLRRIARLVARPALVDGVVVLSADAVEVVGLRVPLPGRLRRQVAFDPRSLRPDLEVRRVSVTSEGVTVQGRLPRVVQPVTFDQIDRFRRRMTRPPDDELEVTITPSHQSPGDPGTPSALP